MRSGDPASAAGDDESAAGAAVPPPLAAASCAAAASARFAAAAAARVLASTEASVGGAVRDRSGPRRGVRLRGPHIQPSRIAAQAARAALSRTGQPARGKSAKR